MQVNSGALWYISMNISDRLEHTSPTNETNIMNLVSSHMQRIDVLKVECQFIWSLVIPCQDSSTIASNDQGTMNSQHECHNDEYIVGQDLVPMEVEDGSPHSVEG
jgi:hypothetical protein